MSIESTLRISAKNLGGLALPGFCPRCFWLGLHYDLPFGGPFPGIFSSLDSYSKKVVHAYFDRYRRAPSWLSPLGEFASYIPPPSSRTFFIDDKATGVRLTGAPDAILVRADGSKAIIDYKTGRHTAGQDQLLPMYDVQLNGYALIADGVGLGPVRQTALVYTEPVTDGDAKFLNEARTDRGFRMDFHAKVVPVALDPGKIPPLLRKARRIFDYSEPPPEARGCEDCANFDTLVNASQNWRRA
jgi:PD-(D/E)XK nuclease superfamily